VQTQNSVGFHAFKCPYIHVGSIATPLEQIKHWELCQSVRIESLAFGEVFTKKVFLSTAKQLLKRSWPLGKSAF